MCGLISFKSQIFCCSTTSSFTLNASISQAIMLPPIRCFTCNRLFTEAENFSEPSRTRYCCQRMQLGYEQIGNEILMRTESRGFQSAQSILRLGVRGGGDGGKEPSRSNRIVL